MHLSETELEQFANWYENFWQKMGVHKRNTLKW